MESTIQIDKKQRIPVLRFKEFDKQWKKRTLGYYYKNLRTGMTPSRLKPKYFKGNIPWITSGELNYGIVECTNEKITEEAVKDTNLRVYPKNTFFIAITGLEAPGTRGKCAINGVPATTNQSCLAFEETPEICTLFLLQWYKKEGIRLYYEFAQGTKQQSFNNKLVRDFIFSVPLLQEQQKIASFLSAVDEKIQQLTRKKELLEQYKKGVMQQLFSGKLRFKDENGEDYSDWKEKKLGEVAEKRIIKNKDNKINLVFTNSAMQGIVNQRDYFDKDIANQNNLLGYYIVEKNDFVYNPRISTYAPVGPISRNYLDTGIMSPLYSVFRFKEGNLDFIECFFSSIVWHTHMKNISNYGARDDRMSFSTGDFYKMPIPFPCMQEQQKIANFLSSIDDKIESTNKQITQTQTFKKGLLQQMFV